MRARLVLGAGACLTACLWARTPLAAQERLIDGFEDPSQWTPVPGEGVSISANPSPGRHGGAARLDFDFHGRGGYAVVRRAVDLPLPENYEISLWIRGAAPSNTLEFKLIDSSGANVWWSVRRNYTPPGEWTRLVIPRRHVTFAWGPRGGGALARAAAIEIAITAGTGGKGTIWLDDLAITEREPVREYTATPRATATGAPRGSIAAAAIDGDTLTAFRAARGREAAVAIDFGQVRTLGGLIVDWSADSLPASYQVASSVDGRRWDTLRTVTAPSVRDYLRLPEVETRHLRLLLRPGRDRSAALRGVTVQPLAWSASRVPMLEAIAAHAPPGEFPRYLLGQQSYWTVVGASGDRAEALLSEDGAVEVAAGGASLEPFIRTDAGFVSWRDAAITHTLEEGDLPVPTVRWSTDRVELAITAGAPPRSAAAPVVVRYRLVNRLAQPQRAILMLALRPFQVNPSWQFLGVPGGPASVGTASRDGDWLRVNGEGAVRLTAPTRLAAAAPFRAGDIAGRLRDGTIPPETSATDADSLASAAVAYQLQLGARDSTDVFVVLPLGGSGRAAAANSAARAPAAMLAGAAAAWRRELAGFRLDGPPAVDTLARAIRTALAHVLINRDGPAIQPGSRAYARSWIRDGALTSTALLRLGRGAEVREFIEWFAPFQYPSGRAPCCVDARGADPVPEHDSSGEFIYLIAEYVRVTGDSALARRLWPAARRAAVFLDSLRHERLTPRYRSGADQIYLGLLPPSISHEGYSAQPVHSYWDDFFALRGFKDAAWLARAVGDPGDAAHWERVATEFRGHFVASIALVRQRRSVPYIPGSADLADLDPTSTTIAGDPAGELDALPRAAVETTFTRYAESAFARARPAAGDTAAWEAYTPYEWRNVGAFVRLGWREHALRLTRQLLGDRRPAAWNQWGEVVWRDPRINRFIGDMPHTWVASDFVRSVLDLFAYERERDASIVLLAGVPREWLEGDGVALAGLHTSSGELGFTARAEGNAVTVRIPAGPRVPAGGIVIRPPRGAEVRVRSLPAVVTVDY
jgi:hypothetical protein